MASENSFQELQFSVPDTRQKVDGFMVFDTGSPEDQESLQTKSKYNLRKSLAWDSAFFTSPGVLDPEELFQTLNLRDMGNSLDTIGNGEQKVVPSESLKVEKTSRNGECNLRKSLAWDSAFFTSAGVLEPEELSMINKGFEKPKSRPLPRIEEMWRSVESNSTIESDGSPLTSLEFDLFEDIRASAQKSTHVSNLATYNTNLRRGRRVKNVHSSTKVDASSQGRTKPILTSRGKSITRHGLERVTSEASVPPQAQSWKGVLQHGAGSGEFYTKPAARSKELHLSSSLISLKPPKISERASRISRASLGANHVKMKTQTVEATSGHCLTHSKKPPLGNSSSSIRGSIQSPRSFLLSLSAATDKSTIPLSSLSTTGTNHVNLVATGSTYKTPPKYTTTNKTELEYSNYPTCLLSMSNSSSCTSPSSSIDGCSLESLSISGNQGLSNSIASFDTTFREVLYDSDIFQASGMETHQPDGPHVGYKSQEKSPSKITRPSGLRRPSPKIGFFDAENRTMPMINQGPHFHSGLQSKSKSETDNTNNPDGASKRTRYGKLQSPRTLKGSNKNMKIGSQQIRVSSPALLIRPSNPVQFGEAENDFLVVSPFPGPMKDSFATTSRAQNNSPYRMRSKDCLKPKKVGNERHQAAELGLLTTSKVEDKGTQGFMRKKGRNCDDENCLKANKQSSRKQGDASMQSAETNMHILHEDEKENLYGVKYQVDTFSRHIGAIDLSRDVVIDLTKKRDPSFLVQHQ